MEGLTALLQALRALWEDRPQRYAAERWAEPVRGDTAADTIGTRWRWTP